MGVIVLVKKVMDIIDIDMTVVEFVIVDISIFAVGWDGS